MAKSPEKPGLSRRQYALTRNVSEAAIRKHISSGLLAPAVLPNNKIDAEAADRLLAASLTRGQRVPIQVSTAKARRQRAQVRLLHDKVEELRKNVVHVADASRIIIGQNLPIMERLRRLPEEAASKVAGLAAPDAHRLLQNMIYVALEDINSLDPDNSPANRSQEVELDGLKATELTAMQLNLQAEMLEIERALSRGEVRLVGDFAEEVTGNYSVLKSLLFAIPGRLAVYMQGANAEEARGRIAEEVEQALAALD